MIVSHNSARFYLNSSATQAPAAGSRPPSHRTHRRIHACQAQGGNGQGPQAEQTGASTYRQNICKHSSQGQPRRIATITFSIRSNSILFSFCSIPTVLGGNLGGVTSVLLGLDDGRTARQLQLDALFPVNAEPTPYKRCIDGTYGYGAFMC
eukprot:1136804-Pelagomonas_calceolata.AAC.2